MGKRYVKNKELNVPRPPSSYAVFCALVARVGCNRIPPPIRFIAKTIVKQHCNERCRCMTEADRKVFVQDASELKDKFATQRKVLLRPEADQAIDEAQPQDVDKGLVQEHIPKPIPDSGTNQECEPQVESILGSAGTCLASGAFPGEWQVLRFLGGGTYGYVFEVADRWGGARLAAKIAGRENTLQDLDAERRLLERLVHPNIVRSFGFAASSAHAALLLELAQSDLAT